MEREKLDSQIDRLDEKVDRLNAHRDEWARLDIDRRIELAEGVVDRAVDIAGDQVRDAIDEKGLRPETPEAAEEWMSGPMAMVRTGRLLVETLKSIRDTGHPPIDTTAVRERTSGDLAIEVFPDSIWDRLLYRGFSAEVWLRSGVDRDNLMAHVAEFYRRDDPEGAVNLVLGAGNVASIPPLDALDKLYARGRVCLLKMNPVNDYLGKHFEKLFEEFIDAGYLEMAYGGVEVGRHLTEHPDIDHIHLTGSDDTHDAIVFGTGEEGARRKQEAEPKIDKAVTSELGNISPVVVVPGPWNDEDIQFQAENIATQLANNCGFNCNAVRVIVMPENWDRREALMDAIAETFEDLPTRTAYYPGAQERFREFVDLEDDVDIIGDPADDELPYAILRDVDPEGEDHPAFNDEAWTTVTSETRLPGDSPGEFLTNAVEFCNDVLWGTLNGAILVHPETRRELGDTLDEAIEELEYGSVAVNHWPALSYGLGVTPWGGYPGQDYTDIQSGIDFVHNTLLFDAPEKSVIYGPFSMSPKPPWFATNSAADEVAPKLVDFEYEPSLGKFLSIVWSSLFG